MPLSSRNGGGPVPPPGDFVDEEGHVLGRHKGIHHYTVGQRRGLGVSAASRLFVKTIDPAKNQVVLTDKDPMAWQITVHSLCRTAPDVGDQPFRSRCEDPPQPPHGPGFGHLSAR